MILIGGGLAVVLATSAAMLLSKDDDQTPARAIQTGGEESTQDDVARTPSFGFEKATREVIRTEPGRLKRRQREANARVADAARDILDDLYTEGFLDPANWEQGVYVEAFRGFTRGAREQAEDHLNLLTAGARASDRYERIRPVSGRISTRILLDRGGIPTLVVSVVRFSAVADGPEPTTLRSRGQYFFERVGGSWKIVSFHVTRADRPRKAA
jgi:hypothetical protein